MHMLAASLIFIGIFFFVCLVVASLIDDPGMTVFLIVCGLGLFGFVWAVNYFFGY